MAATLVLDDATGLQHLELVLNAGRRYRVIAPRPELKAGLLRALRAAAPVAVVAPRGGLIGNLKLWENLVLPSQYREESGSGGAAGLGALEARAEALYRALGVARERFVELCAMLPERLSEFERRLAAFVRGMLAEPQIMVYDGLFDGLTRPEAGRAVRFDRLFLLHFPFRTALYVDTHDPLVPALDGLPVIRL
jgi:predicted ABC-type transport system involved in lysophospholipase L1 biosynthesis ATPase subunit